MSEVTEEVQGMVTELREAKPFSVLNAVREVTYPTLKVRVYLNGELAGKLDELYVDLKLAKAENEDSLASAEVQEIEDKIADVEAQIKSSALVFHMRGVPPKVKRIIFKEGHRKFRVDSKDDEATQQEKSEQYSEYVTYEIMRHAIVKAVAADGSEDTHAWTAAEIAELDSVLHESEFRKLDDAAAKLTSASHLFNESLDADFLSKS